MFLERHSRKGAGEGLGEAIIGDVLLEGGDLQWVQGHIRGTAAMGNIGAMATLKD